MARKVGQGTPGRIDKKITYATWLKMLDRRQAFFHGLLAEHVEDRLHLNHQNPALPVPDHGIGIIEFLLPFHRIRKGDWLLLIPGYLFRPFKPGKNFYFHA
ncbi:hypothetical protein [Komagataeibacter rhaeticus]|uniref:Uncharacterized protein n=1 Tax=Komagataeibacter rhaeticus TaxID=215221 RepID=A0A858JJX7_9PROT|nr:hypothetical protein GWK63_04410 [Komagataeibacter rhaeticus]QOC47360.1 hypothetical protein ICJ78_04410 [Komagataeibacter rhaeticus]